MRCPTLTVIAEILTRRGLTAAIESWEGGPVLIVTTERDRYAAWIDRGCPELHTADLYELVAWRGHQLTPDEFAAWAVDALYEWEAKRERRAEGDPVG